MSDPQQRLARLAEQWSYALGPDFLVPRPAIAQRAGTTPASAAGAGAGPSSPAMPGDTVAPGSPAPSTARPAQPPQPAPRELPPELPPAERREALDRLAAEVKACEACRLCEQRTQTVFADGDPMARVMFVGEGPGADEDRQGVPFVGRAGQLLTRIIEGAMGMPRSAVYICNVVKCRPPNNRNPAPDEMTACGGFLERQIQLVAPDLIFCLGKVASQFVLRSDATMGRMRGRVHRYGKIPVIPTWHPAYLLRSPGAKRETWDDIKLGLRTLGLDENPRPWSAD